MYVRIWNVQVHTAVEYPSFLDIPDSYLSADCKKRVISSATSSSSSSGSGSIQKGVESSVRYALSSVILHHGRKATGGHYSANCRDPKTHTVRVHYRGKNIFVHVYKFYFPYLVEKLQRFESPFLAPWRRTIIDRYGSIHTYIHKYKFTYIHIQTNIHIYTHLWKSHIYDIHVYVYIHTYIHKQTYTYIHTLYIHTYIHYYT